MDANSATPASDLLEDARKRFKTMVLGVAAVYALVVVNFDGEFWPFSKFPMFSRSGRPWTRAYVTEVNATDAALPLAEIWEKELPGQPLALHHYHINQDDLSAVVRSLKRPLSSEQTDFLATYFDRLRHEKTMILYSVHGRLRPDRTVRERFTPLAIIGPEGAREVIVADAAVTSNGGDAGIPLNVDAGAASVPNP